MRTPQVEHALRVFSAPNGTYDPSTVQAAREILSCELNGKCNHQHTKTFEDLGEVFTICACGDIVE